VNDLDVGETLQRLETELLRSEVRRDAARVSELLADEFCEFGVSGRVFTKASIVAELKEERPVAITLEDFACKELADGVALVTYRTSKTVESVATRHGEARCGCFARSGGKCCFIKGRRYLQTWRADGELYV
jgi:hypothetical protein